MGLYVYGISIKKHSANFVQQQESSAILFQLPVILHVLIARFEGWRYCERTTGLEAVAAGEQAIIFKQDRRIDTPVLSCLIKLSEKRKFLERMIFI